MTSLTYRTQLQQQHQEAGDAPAALNTDPADGPVADGAGDDDIINDILGDKPTREPKERRDSRRDKERPEPAASDEDTDEVEVDLPDDDDDEPDTTPDADEDEELEDEELPEAAEREQEAPQGSTKAARAALKAGDVDKAFMLAFGKKPEEVSPTPHVWTAWRKGNEREAQARAADRQALASEREQFNQAAHAERLAIHGAIEKLKPYEKYYLAEQAWQRDGDPASLVDIIQGITRMTYDEAQKVILTKTKRSPAERAMQQRMQQLEQKLQETTAEREQQAQQQTQAQVYHGDLAYIRQNVAGPITKIPKFAERIYTVLSKTRSAAGLTLTVEQAAARVLKSERRRIENHPLVRRKPKEGKPGGKVSDAARTLAQRSSAARTPLRRDSQNNGARNKDTETDDDIISDILSNRRRAG